MLFTAHEAGADGKAGDTQRATRRELAEMQLGILDALPAHIALLDSNGVISTVNEAWLRFGSANGLRT